MPAPSTKKPRSDSHAAAAPSPASREPELNAAAQRVAADVEAVREEDLEPINLDPASVVTTVLGAKRKFEPFFPAIAKLPGVDMARIRKLDDYADALLYWSASATYAGTPKAGLAEMVERAIRQRERALHDLGALVRHGLLAPSLIENFGGSAAHRKVATDLIGLANLVHENWAQLNGKSLITLAAMDEATELGKAIMQGVGDRDLADVAVARDVVRRNKAYTLVVRTYKELRDAITFLRRAEGDVDRIAPSLWSLRRTARRPAEDEPVDPQSTRAPTPTTGPTPRPTPTGGDPASSSSSTDGPLGPKTSSLIVQDA